MKLSLDDNQEYLIQESFSAFNIIFKRIFGVKKDFTNTIGTILLILFLQFVYIFVLFPLAVEKGIIIINTFVFFISFTPLVTLIITLMTEPGVQIKQRGDLATQPDTQQATLVNNVQIHIVELPDQPRIYQERFCETCNIQTPAKASHCRFCNHCVDGFDHHCFWIGNCIGIRNWRIFIIFLTFVVTTLLSISVFGLYLFFDQFSLVLQVWQDMFQKLSISVFAFYCIYFVTGLWKVMSILNILMLILMILGPLIYSISIFNHNPAYQNLHYYNNPFLTINSTILFILQLIIMLPYAITNWNNAIQFKTAKQLKSERDFYLQKNLEYKIEQLNWIQIKQNLHKFFTYPIPQSRFYII